MTQLDGPCGRTGGGPSKTSPAACVSASKLLRAGGRGGEEEVLGEKDCSSENADMETTCVLY